MAAWVLICGIGEGLFATCTRLQGHPVAGSPGVLWVTPEGQKGRELEAKMSGGPSPQSGCT